MPNVITTDQGREFRNNLNEELTNTFGIEHRLTTAYHPQANGLDERYNQTLSITISKFAQKNRESWDEKLPEIVYSYNSAVHESSRHTPFEAMFGRVAKLPVDFNTASTHSPEEKLQEYLTAADPLEGEREAKRRKTEDAIKANIQTAQQKQKHYYDKRHGTSTCFTVGDTVLKKDFRRKKRKGGKLDYRWEGPFLIMAILGKGLFQLKELDGEKVCTITCKTNINTTMCHHY